MAKNKRKLRVIPLGGLGEIGKNITAFEYGDDIVVVDCGLAFPEDDMPGIDMVIPDISYLIKNKEATYMLKVSGDSMKDAGIMNGDMVLVDRSLTAVPGDIVIAEIDKQWTIKYLRKSGKNIYLEPANKKFSNIYPTEELKVAAVVKAVIRKY